MTRSSSFIPYHPSAHNAATAKDATDFLRAHEKMAAILPAVTRMTALQKDCVSALPTMFDSCSVLSFESNQLVLAIPNSAIATKLKQKLPNLQENLLRRGWQVNAIRLKVQVIPQIPENIIRKKLALPTTAISALTKLAKELDESPSNQKLKTALQIMLQKYKT